MTTTLRVLIVLAVAPCLGPLVAAEIASEPLTLQSPDGRLRATFRLGEGGRPEFDVAYRDRPVATATLGLEFAGSGPLREDLKVVAVRRQSRDESYAIPVGKASSARDRHHELIISLEEASPPRRRLDIAIRAFDDGVAFRYLIPGQGPLAEFVLTDELTRLTFPGDPTARALPLKNYTTSYENYYQTRPVSAIGPERLIGLPLLLERAGDGAGRAWLAVTEANLTDYAGLYLSGVEGAPGTLAARLSPLPGRANGAKVVGQAPHASPWRVLMVADDPGRLLESHLVFHLSDPPAIHGQRISNML